jgi:dynein heavy chain
MSTKELGINDARIEFAADYVLKSLNIKPDKFANLHSSEETRQLLLDFFDKADKNILVISQPSAALNANDNFPGKPKGKGCYFVKKNKESCSKDANLRSCLLYGDLSSAPLEQLSAFVDEVAYFSYLKSEGGESSKYPRDFTSILMENLNFIFMI